MSRSSQSITLASDSKLRDRGLFRILAGNIALSMKPIKQNDNIQYTKQILKYTIRIVILHDTYFQ